jgi:hypothetical protein
MYMHACATSNANLDFPAPLGPRTCGHGLHQGDSIKQLRKKAGRKERRTEFRNSGIKEIKKEGSTDVKKGWTKIKKEESDGKKNRGTLRKEGTVAASKTKQQEGTKEMLGKDLPGTHSQAKSLQSPPTEERLVGILRWKRCKTDGVARKWCVVNQDFTASYPCCFGPFFLPFRVFSSDPSWL